MPLLKNLPENFSLELSVLDGEIESEVFHSFIENFSLKVSCLRLRGYYVENGLFDHLHSFGWIRNFKRLERLEMCPSFYAGGIEDLYESPLPKLKELINPECPLISDRFLLRINAK